jgi:hypothetical protein
LEVGGEKRNGLGMSRGHPIARQSMGSRLSKSSLQSLGKQGGETGSNHKVNKMHGAGIKDKKKRRTGNYEFRLH